MPNIALLALEAGDGTVVITSITLVFSMLVALCLVITLEGKIFASLNEKKNKPTPPQAPASGDSAPKAVQAPAASAAQSAPAAPAVAGGIPGDIIAAIAAAVATLEGDGAVVRGIRRAATRVATKQAGSRRGAWGDAGVRDHTTPFM